MPRTKKSTRNAQRSAPYNARSRASRPSTSSTKAKGGFRFLDLPYDVKLMIYGHLEQEPEECDRDMTPQERKERGRISKARKSLLLVNHQINEEFTPIFYRSVRVIVHADKQRLGRLKVKIPGEFPHCNAEEFEKYFLSTARIDVLQHIRRIEYNIGGASEDPCHDRHEMSDFVAVLRKYDSVLVAMVEVVVFGAPSGEDEDEIPLEHLLWAPKRRDGAVAMNPWSAFDN